MLRLYHIPKGFDYVDKACNQRNYQNKPPKIFTCQKYSYNYKNSNTGYYTNNCSANSSRVKSYYHSYDGADEDHDFLETFFSKLDHEQLLDIFVDALYFRLLL